MKPGLVARAAEVMGAASETDTWFWRRITIWAGMTACFLVWVYLILDDANDETSRAEFNICGWVMALCISLHVLGPRMENAISNVSARFGHTAAPRHPRTKPT